MRNRGVEIYMSPLEEINSFDIHSMLELQGICDKTIRFVLIEIHTIMINLVTGISINHLLRTAYLVSQNIKRNQLILQTIKEICVDTYARCLNGNAKQNAISEISLVLEGYPIISNEFLCPNLTTLEILQSSSLCYIKQQCYVLEQYKQLNDTNLEDLLLCFFGRSSSSDISVRSQWLTMHLNCDKEAIGNFIKQPPNLEFDLLNFVTKSIDFVNQVDLPYDFRYLPAIYFNKVQHTDTSPLAENKIHLILDHALNKALDGNIASTILDKKSKLTLVKTIFLIIMVFNFICF